MSASQQWPWPAGLDPRPVLTADHQTDATTSGSFDAGPSLMPAPRLRGGARGGAGARRRRDTRGRPAAPDAPPETGRPTDPLDSPPQKDVRLTAPPPTTVSKTTRAHTCAETPWRIRPSAASVAAQSERPLREPDPLRRVRTHRRQERTRSSDRIAAPRWTLPQAGPDARSAVDRAVRTVRRLRFATWSSRTMSSVRR